MPAISSDIVGRAEELFAAGEISSRVAARLKISGADALALKHAWLAKTQVKAPKAEKPAPKAKKEK